MNVYSYIRVSSIGQLDGDGPERQRDAIAAFCNKFALESRGEFVEAKTGKAEAQDRPVFTEMLLSIGRLNNLGDPALRIDAIVVERLDRLARDMMVSEMLLRACRQANIQLFATDQGQIIDMANDSDEPTRTLMRQILAAVAQWEKSVLVKKLNTAIQRVKLAKGRCSGKRPYGTHPGEKETKELILSMHAEGKWDAWIARKLNEMGKRTRHNKEWNEWSVQYIRCGKKKRPLLQVGPKNAQVVNPFNLVEQKPKVTICEAATRTS